MKGMMKLVGIVVLAVFTGFSTAGCDNFLPKNNEPDDTDDDFVPVTNIDRVNTSVFVGTVYLGGRVVPADATKKTIIWSVQPGGDIKGKINGSNLTTTADGFVKVKATVENGLAKGKDYEKNFTIFVDPFVPVKDITRNFPYESPKGELTLDGKVSPDNASYDEIVWTVKDAGTTKAWIKYGDDTLNTSAKGKVLVTANILYGKADGVNYTKDFPIDIIDDPDTTTP